MKNILDKPYNVPVIPPDLRREETIHQICDALTYLDQVAKDAFSRISARVAENHERLKVSAETGSYLCSNILPFNFGIV